MARPNLGKLLASNAFKKGNASQSTTKTPARTRFAPSPTGVIHLGSLRTALYNYLLARATGGEFILRIEDTDRSRLKPGAERNILESLKWTKVLWDEGPIRQSDRQPVYSEYARKLLDEGHAYRCFCSKERLDSLTESARKLWPPSTASYDRKCAHLTEAESSARAADGETFVLRFKSPPVWPKFHDVLHGEVEASTQINQADPRYDDFVLLKSDGMPTYHFANVVDDSLMKITHVVRGEEWLPSTPKHIALYSALQSTPPNFVHIPLLTGTGGKKLSKRKSDQGILEMRGPPEYILPEALTNFIALLGWSPASNSRNVIGKSVSDMLTMEDIERSFSLDGLTKGNIQVDFGKLHYLNKQHFERLLRTDFEDAVKRCHEAYSEISLQQTRQFLEVLKAHVSCVADYVKHIETIFAQPKHENKPKDPELVLRVAQTAVEDIKRASSESGQWEPQLLIDTLVRDYSKKANMALRFALLDGKPGVSILEALTILGPHESTSRLQGCLSRLSSKQDG